MSKPHAQDHSITGFETSKSRVAIAALLFLVGLAWIIVFYTKAADAAFYVDGMATKPANPIPWMAKLKLWNYLIGFGLIIASLWVMAHKSTPLGRGRGVVVGMLGCLLIGLIWIVLFYLIGNTGKVPVMNHIGQWNLALGMAFIASSFAFATKWE